jgi:hypothetical protein
MIDGRYHQTTGDVGTGGLVSPLDTSRFLHPRTH